ncbi:hypothetical protein [Pseudomonas sp. BP8]|uniref:hypothetical protein n=1 Tax=Pseudomonas sp. BP8 TaxID=2817864 RepID=UPI001AE548DA|nr:hypothetical protein [Pseudomonas sp. BP8]MBP2261005.1 hypothetical protein [Pseudomonas sp. BP8]HDS1736182.1 hypothetical protein [Pseudomonas putida]
MPREEAVTDSPEFPFNPHSPDRTQYPNHPLYYKIFNIAIRPKLFLPAADGFMMSGYLEVMA